MIKKLGTVMFLWLSPIWTDFFACMVLTKGTQRITFIIMKYFEWDNDKNAKLKDERGISFEEVVFHMERGDILDILEHPNQGKYGGQRIMVIDVEGYAYLVPFLETDNSIVLKTIIPSRKATRRYLPGRE